MERKKKLVKNISFSLLLRNRGSEKGKVRERERVLGISGVREGEMEGEELVII